ncbi:hypothetical protein [Streptomyces sp. MBT49]|uniref:hypothetical protein n=1 Tax=Streptomyces sp. MBT49 TaxID=1488380 RepID=UPI001F190C08|nr:hypothetical protein [Streptomyces sp. MBT49]
MITPADDFDDGPASDPDDPLTVILRPAPGHLGPPPGRYEEIRRGAARRRLVRTAAGAGAACAVAALAVLLPLHLTAADGPARPTVPLAPPPATGTPSTLPPSSSPSPVPATGDPVEGSRSPAADQRASAAAGDSTAPDTGRGRSPRSEPTSGGERSTTATEPPTPSAAPSDVPSVSTARR